MTITDDWVIIPELFIQNTTGLKMLLKIQDTQPTTDEDAMVLTPVTRSNDGSFLNDATLGTLWGRIDDDRYDATKVYTIANY